MTLDLMPERTPPVPEQHKGNADSIRQEWMASDFSSNQGEKSQESFVDFKIFNAELAEKRRQPPQTDLISVS